MIAQPLADPAHRRRVDGIPHHAGHGLDRAQARAVVLVGVARGGQRPEVVEQERAHRLPHRRARRLVHYRHALGVVDGLAEGHAGQGAAAHQFERALPAAHAQFDTKKLLEEYSLQLFGNKEVGKRKGGSFPEDGIVAAKKRLHHSGYIVLRFHGGRDINPS